MSKKTIHILIIIVVICTNLFFGFPRISHFTAGDETLWSYDRVPKFWRSVAKGNWRGTNLCDKPGITLAMISGAGLPFIPDPRDYEKLTRLPKTPEQLAMIEKIYFSLRLPVYLFTLASLFIFYFLLKRLLSAEIALLSVIFIGLSPILLGISLIVNTDAILWILMPITLVSFLIYQKEPTSPADKSNQKFLYLTGFLLGLAILDKFVANFLFPFLLVLVFVKYILSNYVKTEDKIEYFKKAMRDYLIIIAIALLTIFLFYPSAWIKPKELLNTTIYSLAFAKIWPLIIGTIAIISADIFLWKSTVSRKICDFFSNHKTAFVRILSVIILVVIAFTLLNTYVGMKFYNFEKILSDPKDGEFFENFFSAFYPLLFGLTPLISLLFLSSIILLTKIKSTELTKNIGSMRILPFILFVLIYYVANSISNTGSTIRYQIVNYPIASIIAVIGLCELIEIKSIKKYFSGIRFYFLIFFIFIISIISLALTKPFFLAYSSKLLPAKFITNLKDMGDGSWETSQYLNSLPNANQLSIWSDKKQVCEKFVGKCNASSNQKYIGTSKFDYLVSSRGGIINIPTSKNQKSALRIGADIVDTKKLYSPNEYYDFKVNIDNRENDFIKVINPTKILSN
ncbi:MAG: glycosyltransferase family 39 protein [bacterium]|nr:glycosyltransferase family 39 protein [bacterium]